MNQLEETDISCPYCGETITVLIDESVEFQQYIEDCQVCCRPINFKVSTDFVGNISACVSGENET